MTPRGEIQREEKRLLGLFQDEDPTGLSFTTIRFPWRITGGAELTKAISRAKRLIRNCLDRSLKGAVALHGVFELDRYVDVQGGYRLGLHCVCAGERSSLEGTLKKVLTEPRAVQVKPIYSEGMTRLVLGNRYDENKGFLQNSLRNIASYLKKRYRTMGVKQVFARARQEIDTIWSSVEGKNQFEYGTREFVRVKKQARVKRATRALSKRMRWKLQQETLPGNCFGNSAKTVRGPVRASVIPSSIEEFLLGTGAAVSRTVLTTPSQPSQVHTSPHIPGRGRTSPHIPGRGLVGGSEQAGTPARTATSRKPAEYSEWVKQTRAKLAALKQKLSQKPPNPPPDQGDRPSGRVCAVVSGADDG